MLDKARLGQAIARGMDKVNEAAVGAIRVRISGLGAWHRPGHRQLPPPSNIGIGHIPKRRTGGLLRKSIGRSKAAFFGTADALVVRSAVGSNAAFDADSVVYAATHEYGRGAIPARPYVRPEVEAREKDYSREVGANIVQLWEEQRR